VVAQVPPPHPHSHTPPCTRPHITLTSCLPCRHMHARAPVLAPSTLFRVLFLLLFGCTSEHHKGVADRLRETLDRERQAWDAERAQLLQDAQVWWRQHAHTLQRPHSRCLARASSLLNPCHPPPRVSSQPPPLAHCCPDPLSPSRRSLQRGYVSLYENITSKAQELVLSMSDEVGQLL
jgi:hypothetical protein